MSKPAPRRWWILRPGQSVRALLASEMSAAALVFACCLTNSIALLIQGFIHPFPISY